MHVLEAALFANLKRGKAVQPEPAEAPARRMPARLALRGVTMLVAVAAVVTLLEIASAEAPMLALAAAN